jgi:hypothetical protein
MKFATYLQLKAMTRSLQQHIDLANELKLQFAAQLLAMAVMEITTNIHGISQQELDALCDRIEEKSPRDETPATIPLPELRSYNRRPRVRRSRAL